MEQLDNKRHALLRDMGAMIVGQLSHPAICSGKPFELQRENGYSYRGIAGYRVAQVLLNTGLRNRELANALTPEKLAQFMPWETDKPPAAYIDPASMRYVTVEAQFPAELQKTSITLDSVGQAPGDGMRFIAGPDMRGRCVTLPTHSIKHVLGAGTTGSGKSTFLQSAAYQISLANKPGEPARNIIVLITGKMSAAFSGISGLPGQQGPIAADAQAIINALSWVVAEMNRRYEILERTGELIVEPQLHVFFDEFQEVTEDARDAMATELVRQIAVKGRECGIHLWATTHKPNLKMFGKAGNAVKGQFDTTIGLHMTDPVSSRVLRGDDTCTHLCGSGDARIQAEVDGTVIDARVQMLYIPEHQLKARAGGKPTMEVWPPSEVGTLERSLNRRGRPTLDFSDEQLACAIYAAQNEMGLPALQSLLGDTGQDIGGHGKLDKLLKKGQRISSYLEDLS